MLEHRVSDQVQARTTHRRLASIALRVPDVRVLDPVAHGTAKKTKNVTFVLTPPLDALVGRSETEVRYADESNK